MAPPKPAPKKKAAVKGRWGLYETSGGLKRKNRYCPKCGTGTFLGRHKDRLSCGTCHYTEFVKV
ncbi:30S ribosomal protein S27ae [Candidatus Woesearchaeota archaeon]|nr:30S ribosomal protein S27ae [Candidatus Woesearchaeota archaeon]